jgi:hypothetical protein
MREFLIVCSLFSASPCFAQVEREADKCSPSGFGKPTYPLEAVRARILGTVKASFSIGTDGKPERVEYTGHRILIPGAKVSIDRTRVDPGCRGLAYTLVFKFQLESIYEFDNGNPPLVHGTQAVTFRPPDEFLIVYFFDPVDKSRAPR